MSLSPRRSCRTLRALLLLVVACSVITPAWAEWQDPVYILFPRIRTDSVSTTAVAIANPTDEDAVVLMWYVPNNGTELKESDAFLIPANNQLARQITELFPGTTQLDGFLVLGSTNISVVGFFLAYNSDLANHQIDGAEAVVLLGGLPGTVIFPELTTGTGAFTEINVVQLSKSPLKVTLSLYRGSGGAPLQTKQVTVPAGDIGGRYSGRVNEIFTVSIPSPGYVTATADPTSGYGLIGYEHFGNDRAFGGRNAIPAPIMAREIPFSLFGSQLAEGLGYMSEITLINPTDRAANVKISAFRTGFPTVSGSPNPVATKTAVLPAHGMIKQRARTLLSLPAGDFVGWMRVDSDIAGVVGDITFGDANSTPQKFMSSVQLHSSPVSDFVFSHVADGMGFITGLTFLNINPDPASVHMDVFDVDGNKTGSTDFVLQPYEHGPRTLGQLVPGFHPQIGGFVHVTSDIDIFAFELFLYIPSGQVLSLSAVPPQRGNGTMSGVLTPAMVDSAGLSSALSLMKLQPKYPASMAKGIRMDEQLEFMPGEMIVEIRSSAAPDALERLAERHGASVKVKSPNAVHLLRTFGVESVSLLRAGGGSLELAAAKRATLDAVEALNLEPDVVYAEPNYISHIDKVPNDPFYDYQWHYPYVKLPEAWDITTGSTDTIVAIIDTGAKYVHPDLGPRLAGAGYDYDFITDPQISLDGDGPDANADDPGDDPNKENSSFHGSHVAGTIGAATNDGTGVAGINWACRLMILRALGAGGGTDYDIAQAILYAARLQNGTNRLPTKAAKVINMSLSSEGSSTTERNAVQAALNAGVIIVSAAGNKGNDTPRYPAAYPGVIAVGATDLSGELAPYSNYGSHVSVVAPGGNTATDLNDDGYVDGVLSCGWKQDTDKASYPFYQGTSMASPHVAGIVSLLLAKNPNLPPAQVKQYLQETAIDLGDPGKDDRYGYGMVDPVAALKRVMNSSSGTPKLVVSTDKMDFGYTETEMSATVSNGGGGTLSITGTSVSTSQGSGWLSATRSGSVVGVKVNRGNLANGDYSGTVTVNSNGGNATIAVSMKVGTPTGPGNLGTMYILTLDPRTLNTIGSLDSDSFPELLGDSNKDGKLEFQFPPVFAGYYFVVAGNDADDDSIICEDGEYCGLYPVSSQLSLVQIFPNEDTPGVDFVLEKPTSPASASAIEELRLRTGIRGFSVIRKTLSSAEIQKVFRQKLTEAGK